MVYDEKLEIITVIKEIKEITSKNLNRDLNLEKALGHLNLDKIKKQEFIKDTKSILDSLGEKRWRDDKHREIIQDHSLSLGVEFQDLYNLVMDSFYDRYFGTDPKTIKKLREKLQILSSIVQGKKLREILKECFRPTKKVEYDKVRFILNKILDDEFIYSQEKIEPTCEHIVPKKHYNGNIEYVSDIHNLYLAINQVNTIRDTKKYSDIEKNNKPKKYFGNKYTEEYFEPIDQSKGIVARSCAYFFTVYPELFGYITDVIDIETLKKWGMFKPDLSEHNRNLFVYQLQHNINPYIVYPRLVQHAFLDVDDKQLATASAEKDLIKYTDNLQNSLLEIEKTLSKYVDNTDDHIKGSYGLLRLNELKESFARFNRFWM